LGLSSQLVVEALPLDVFFNQGFHDPGTVRDWRFDLLIFGYEHIRWDHCVVTWLHEEGRRVARFSDVEHSVHCCFHFKVSDSLEGFAQVYHKAACLWLDRFVLTIQLDLQAWVAKSG